MGGLSIAMGYKTEDWFRAWLKKQSQNTRKGCLQQFVKFCKDENEAIDAWAENCAESHNKHGIPLNHII